MIGIHFSALEFNKKVVNVSSVIVVLSPGAVKHDTQAAGLPSTDFNNLSITELNK